MSKILSILLLSSQVLITHLNADEPMSIRGFMDVGAGYAQEDEKLDFTTGTLDLYITKELSENFYSLVELVFETEGSSFITDLERLQISYDINEYATSTFGKFHTPYGYWHTAFHHGAQIQTSILRPKFLAFEDEGGVLPAHGVGIWANGAYDDFSYDIYITNGSQIGQLEDNAPGNQNGGGLETNNGDAQEGGNLIGGNFAYTLGDLKLGIHLFHQNVAIFNNRSSELFTYGAYLAYETETFEVMAESYFFNNKNGSGLNQDKTLDSYAAFVQVAYTYDLLTPYIRVESTSYNEEDLYFQAQADTIGSSYQRYAGGIRYAIEDSISIKLAYVFTDQEHLDDTYDVLTQLAISF